MFKEMARAYQNRKSLLSPALLQGGQRENCVNCGQGQNASKTPQDILGNENNPDNKWLNRGEA